MLDINVFIEKIKKKSRLLGIDPGGKRIGIAISDENKIVATPYTTIIRENYPDLISQINKIVEEYKIDGIISDTRYRLYTNKVACIFITHQLKIQSPYFSNFIQRINYNYIYKFNACWVMDCEKNNLAGNLSKPKSLPNNTLYIGNQSRFEYQESKKKYDFLAIVSGPEPQRTILENGLIKALKNMSRGNEILFIIYKIKIFAIIGFFK